MFVCQICGRLSPLDKICDVCLKAFLADYVKQATHKFTSQDFMQFTRGLGANSVSVAKKIADYVNKKAEGRATTLEAWQPIGPVSGDPICAKKILTALAKAEGREE